MKNLYLITFLAILFTGCENNTKIPDQLGEEFKNNPMMPDELGEKLFKAFKSNNTENLINLRRTVEEMIATIEEETKGQELSEEDKSFISRFKNSEGYRLEANNRNKKKFVEDFVESREKLINIMKSDIKNYSISEIRGMYYFSAIRDVVIILLEINKQLNDPHYIAFTAVKVIRGSWKFGGAIWLEDFIWLKKFKEKKYIKYRDLEASDW